MFVITVLAGHESSSAGQERMQAADCFPFESLPDPLRQRAERLLLNALDSQALYTIAADIKPMSSSFNPIDEPHFYDMPGVYILGLLIIITIPAILRWRNVWRSNRTVIVTTSGIVMLSLGLFRISVIASRNADELDQIMRTWTCGGEISGSLYRFKSIYDGTQQMDIYVFNIPRMAKTIIEHSSLFAAIEVSSSSSALDVVRNVNRADRATVHRCNGLLFGYPEDAVGFFVDAEKHMQATGERVERDFVSLPTFLGDHYYSYVVPKGAGRSNADRILAARVQPVFDEYLKRRARHIRDDSGAGALSLVREWFDDGAGHVRPSNAWRRHTETGNHAR